MKSATAARFFIGRNLPEDRIRQGFESCIA
jgi:hypothetical protein